MAPGGAELSEDALDAAVVAARNGDRAAIDLLFRDVQPRLLRYLAGQQPAAAEDLAAETWLALAPRLGEVDGGIAGLRKLAFTIARRRAIDALRKQPPTPVRALTDDDLARLPGRGGATDPASTAVDAMTTEAAIALLTEVLPTEWAEVLLLRIVGGLTAAEVGEILGKSAGAVRVIQHRALALAADRLAGGLVTP